MKLGHLLALLPLPVYAAKYEEYILAPTSRTLHPVYIHQINGSVSSAHSLTGDAPGSAIFQGQSAVTYDFGKVRYNDQMRRALLPDKVYRMLQVLSQSRLETQTRMNT